jgi:hypothetical protein
VPSPPALAAPELVSASRFFGFRFSVSAKKKKKIRLPTMSSKLEAPQQFKQPSRKGKKAWRKNVDVTEVNEGLRLLKEEEIKGYVQGLYQHSESLLTLD